MRVKVCDSLTHEVLQSPSPLPSLPHGSHPHHLHRRDHLDHLDENDDLV